jgi:hypothetical protein
MRSLVLVTALAAAFAVSACGSGTTANSSGKSSTGSSAGATTRGASGSSASTTAGSTTTTAGSTGTTAGSTTTTAGSTTTTAGSTGTTAGSTTTTAGSTGTTAGSTSGSTGTTGCTNACTIGSVSCSGNQVLTCQSVGGCAQFVAGATCSGTQTCQNGVCADPTCAGGCNTPPGASCQDPNTRVTFSSSGTCNNGQCSYGATLQACAYGCSQGVCLPQPTCTPSATRCNGTQVETCNVNGTAWLFTENCSSTCSAGLCDAPCTPSVTRCNGAVVDTCNGAGTAWVPAASACASGCIAGGCLEPSLTVSGSTVYLQGEHHYSGTVTVELGGQIIAGPGPDGGAATGQLTIYAPEIDINQSSSIAGSVSVGPCVADPDDVASGIRLIANVVRINGTLNWSGTACSVDGIVVRADTINGSGTVSVPSGRSLLLFGTGGVAPGLNVGSAVKSLMPPARITSANFPAGGLYNSDAPPPLFSWDRPYSTVSGYYYVSGSNAAAVPTSISTFDSTEALALQSPPPSGTSYLNVVSADTNGNVGTVPHRFAIRVQGAPPVLDSPTNPVEGQYTSNPAVTVRWQAGSGNPGVGYYYVFDHYPDTRPTAQTGTFVAPDKNPPQIFQANVAPGRWWFHMIARDSMGYLTLRAAHYEVDIGSAPATGTLAGTVSDGTNNLAGASIVIQRGLYTGKTDTNGIYDFNNSLPAGTYEVVASKAGFQSVQKTVTVNASQTATQPFILPPGSGCPSCTDLCSGVSCPTAALNGAQWTSTCNAGTCVNAALYGEGFEGVCPDGWTLVSPNGVWACGAPTSGPGSAHGGLNVLATNLTGLYPNNVNWGSNTATSPAISLVGATRPSLSFWTWYDTEGSSYDGFNLKVSTDGINFLQASSVTPGYALSVAGQTAWGGHPSAWQQYSADLTAYAGQTVYLRFDFHSDGSANYSGVYLDDLVIADN